MDLVVARHIVRHSCLKVDGMHMASWLAVLRRCGASENRLVRRLVWRLDVVVIIVIVIVIFIPIVQAVIDVLVLRKVAELVLREIVLDHDFDLVSVLVFNQVGAITNVLNHANAITNVLNHASALDSVLESMVIEHPKCLPCSRPRIAASNAASSSSMSMSKLVRRPRALNVPT